MKPMAPPFKSLRFLYLGSADFDADLAYYRQVLGADRVWQFDAFESQVAAVRLGDGSAAQSDVPGAET